MAALRFTKMHGLGNDFMVIDGINQLFVPHAQQIAGWANRHTGVGFDQLLLVEKSTEASCAFRYRIFNGDGAEVEQCGNGARCFFQFIHEKNLTEHNEVRVQTAKGVITLSRNEQGVCVNMGLPRWQCAEVPFIPRAGDEGALTHIVENQKLSCVSMGNPHAVIIVDDVKTASVESTGSLLESHAQFPERVNVGFMQIVSEGEILLRVFERGAGETMACGSGACAAAAVGIRLGLLNHRVTVHQSGGELIIEQTASGEILMTGPAQTVFEGVIHYD